MFFQWKLKSQVLPQKKRRETNANPHGVAHLQPEAEKPVAWMEQKAMRAFKQPKHSP